MWPADRGAITRQFDLTVLRDNADRCARLNLAPRTPIFNPFCVPRQRRFADRFIPMGHLFVGPFLAIVRNAALRALLRGSDKTALR
jgi:hypothetical protein